MAETDDDVELDRIASNIRVWMYRTDFDARKCAQDILTGYIKADSVSREPFYVIERFEDGKSAGYWNGVNSETFVDVIDHAIQFRRKQDAIPIRSSYGWRDVQITEHLYLDTRATAAAPLDAPFQLPVQVHRNTPYFEIWAGTSRIAKFNEASGKAREIAEYIAARLNTTTTPTQPETPLHWPFAAKHENCADCSREYEPPPKQDEASDAPEPPDPAAKVPSDLIAWKWANTLSQSEQDVLLGSSVRRLQEAITTALRAERERAARIAEAMAMGETYETGRQKAINIAAAIRSKESSDGE